MRRRRNRSLALGLLGPLVAALLLAHSSLGMGHDTEAEGHAIQDALSICLAVVEIAGAFLLLAMAVPLPHRRRFPGPEDDFASISMVALAGADWPARASPAALQVFRL